MPAVGSEESNTAACLSGLEVIAVLAPRTPTDSFLKLGDALPKGESPTEFHATSRGLEINDQCAAVPMDAIFSVR